MIKESTQLWIMVDIETSGPIYGTHSMTELGAAVGCVQGGVMDRFEALIRPVGEEVVTSRDSFDRARRDGIDPEAAMQRFADWCEPWIEKGARFIARPAAFDWPWIVYYSWRFLGKNPFGFKAACASSWFEAKSKRFEVKLPHVAVKDAEIQLVQFLYQGIMRRGTTGHRLRWLQYREGGIICAVAFSRDSRFLLATSFGETVDVWDVERAEIVLTFGGHSRSVYSVAVSSGGTVVASGDGEPDEKPGSVLLWDLKTGKEIHRFAGAKRGNGHWWTVTGLAFSPDDGLLASCSLDCTVKLWDLKTRELVRTFVGQAELNCVAFDSEGKRLAAGGGPERPGWIGVWDVQTGRAILDFNGHRRDVTEVVFAPDSGSLISSSMDGTVRVWDAETERKIRNIRAHERGLTSMALGTDGRLLVTAGDRVVKFWSVDEWRELGSLIVHDEDVTRVAISPDGRWLASVHGYKGELALHRLEPKDLFGANRG